MKSLVDRCIKCGKELNEYEELQLIDDQLCVTYTCQHCNTCQLKFFEIILVGDCECINFIEGEKL